MTGNTITKVGGVDVDLRGVAYPLVMALQKATNLGDAAAIREAEADILADVAFKGAFARPGALNAAGFHPFAPIEKVAGATTLKKR